VRVEIFTPAHEVEAIVSAIIRAARSGATGHPRDGVVAVLPIDQALPDPAGMRSDGGELLAEARRAARRGVIA